MLRRIDPQVLQAKREAEARERSEARKAANLSALASVPAHRLHQGTYSADIRIPTSIPKAAPVRSEAYRRLVAAMPCKHCGIVGYSQAAHPNTGKGAGTKTDDRECFPLCTVHPSPGGGGYVRGCHEKFDQGGLYTKEARRSIEPAWSADTRRQILAAGAWPASLPLWETA